MVHFLRFFTIKTLANCFSLMIDSKDLNIISPTKKVQKELYETFFGVNFVFRFTKLCQDILLLEILFLTKN